MRTKFYLTILLACIFAVSTIALNSCKKDDDDDDDNNSTDYVLVVENGAQSIEPGESISYSAVLIDEEGSVTVPSGIVWSVTPDSVASINSSGVLTTSSTGKAKVTATIQVDGASVSASVPVGVYAPVLFAVAPSAILFEAGHQIQLETVYFSNSAAPTYSFASSNSSVASVSNSGLVSLNAAGECLITVTASNQPNSPFYVPVLVIDVPSVPLPVTRVELNHYSKDLFKNETLQLSATAYNMEGVVSNANIAWASMDNNIATVSSNGLVTPVRTGETYVTATANGIMAQCEILVNPDTVIIVTPFYKDLQQGETFQFTATAYKNQRSGFGETYPINFSWLMPDYGPGFEMFNVGTVDNNGNVTISNSAMMGMMSFVMAYDPSNEYVAGAAMIMIDVGMPSW